MANIPLQSITFPGLSDKYTTPAVDTTLTQTGAAADAKKTGDEIGAIKNDFTDLSEKVDSAFVTDTATGSIASFPDGADDVPVKDLTVAIEPVQSGSGDPAPDNVRPISGWTGANVTACGVNIFNPDASTYETFDLTGEGVYRYGHSYPSGTYTIINNTDHEMYYRLPTKDLSNRGATIVINSTVTANVTVDADHIMWVFASGSSYDTTNFMVALGTETVFKAFQGETYEVDWTTEAGTVYGGTLDVTTGVLTVTHGVLNLADLAWSGLDAKSRRYINMASVIKNHSDLSMVADIISDTYQTVANNTLYNDTSAIGIAQNDGFIFIRTPDNEVPSGVLVYPLLTPTTSTVTGQTVESLYGDNNVFADAGDVTVQYRADTKLYIDKVLSQA